MAIERMIREIENEISTADTNQSEINTDYEDYLGLIDGERDQKEYDWQSDIRIPEFMYHFLTQSAIDVQQYFATRDFVEVKINDPSPEAKASADAAKECLNRTLNQRDIRHYLKFVRGKSINNLSGRVWLKCWWERKTQMRLTGQRQVEVPLDIDVNGEPITEDWQVPDVDIIQEDVFEDVPVKDMFNYDVWDQRNVFASNDYAYSAQDKEWVIFRSEMTKSALEDAAEANGYFDIDKIGAAPETTKTKEESYQKYKTTNLPDSSAQRPYDIYERYGKMWIITKGDKEEFGVDDLGNPIDGAEYKEAIITTVMDGRSLKLIGFQSMEAAGWVDALGNPYRPIIRGLCYIHPAEDDGIGDGRNVRELQTAIDDTFNMAQDRTMLATMPTMKMRAGAADDRSDLRIAPMHVMELTNPEDLQEMVFHDNTVPALNQISMLRDVMQQVDNINESAAGSLPSLASQTATAVGAANANTNIRTNFKSMTHEYTVLCDLYWMILQMTYAFATEQTAFKLMGEKVYDFNPSLDYYYTPLSQSIEPEASKAVKRKEYLQLMQIAAQTQHPDTPKIMNYAFLEYVKLTGDEYEAALGKTLDEKTPVAGGSAAQDQSTPTSNEQGLPQSQDEMMTREVANV